MAAFFSTRNSRSANHKTWNMTIRFIMILSLTSQNFISNYREISRTPDVQPQNLKQKLVSHSCQTNVTPFLIYICISCVARNSHTLRWNLEKFREALNPRGRITSRTQIRWHRDSQRTLTRVIRRNKKRNYVAYPLHYCDAINFRRVLESTATCSRWDYMIDNGRSYRMIG